MAKIGGKYGRTLSDFDPNELDLTFPAANDRCKVSSNSIQNFDRSSDDKQTHTYRQTNASDLIICPSSSYSIVTDKTQRSRTRFTTGVIAHSGADIKSDTVKWL